MDTPIFLLYIITFVALIVLGFQLWKIQSDIDIIQTTLNDIGVLLIEIYKKLDKNKD